MQQAGTRCLTRPPASVPCLGNGTPGHHQGAEDQCMVLMPGVLGNSRGWTTVTCATKAHSPALRLLPSGPTPLPPALYLHCSGNPPNQPVLTPRRAPHGLGLPWVQPSVPTALVPPPPTTGLDQPGCCCRDTRAGPVSRERRDCLCPEGLGEKPLHGRLSTQAPP